VIHEEPPSPRKLNGTIPRDLETITLKCLEKDPSRRYQTAQALADDLAHWLDGEPITARPVTWMERSWRWCRRKPGLARLYTVIAVLLITLGIGGSSFALREHRLRVSSNLAFDELHEVSQTLRQERTTARSTMKKLAETLYELDRMKDMKTTDKAVRQKLEETVQTLTQELEEFLLEDPLSPGVSDQRPYNPRRGAGR
jgi:serine/threonine protein kinase